MRILRQSPLFVLLLCVLLVVARSSGAHIHLCLDQQEPTAVHVGDVDFHVASADSHQDVDFFLTDDGVTKSKTADVDYPVLIAFILLLVLFPQLRSASLPSYKTPAVSRLRYALPASPRAPPL